MGRVLGKLPPGWVEATIGDVTVQKIPQGLPPQDGRFTYIDISSIDNETKEVISPKSLSGEQAPSRARQSVLAGDVLVSMTRPNLNAVALVPAELNYSIASTGFDVLRAIEIEPRWLFNLVRSQGFVRDMTALVQGALYPAIRSENVRSYKIPIPPLREQERIVIKIEELQGRSRRAREAQEDIPDLLDQLRQSVLAAAFRGDLTKAWWAKRPDIKPASELLNRIVAERREQWEQAELEKLKAKGLTEGKLDFEFTKRRKQYKEPVPVNTTDLPRLPKGWCWYLLSEIGYMNRGKSRHRPRNAPHLYGGKYPFIQTGDISQSRGRITSHKQTYSEAGLAQSKLWPEGTVCITIAANIANSAILTYPACFPDSVVGVLPDNRICPPEYIEFFIRTVRNELDRFAPATAQKNINIEILNNVVIPLPPREEVDEILRLVRLSFRNIERAESELRASLSRLIQLDQTIFLKAFSGELVPQDPNDEPASVLLDRIRAGKAQIAAKEKNRAKGRGRVMKRKVGIQQDVITVLREAGRPMAPEDVFTAGGFEEESVDEFYEQLRKAVANRLVREIRKGSWVGLEAIRQ